MTIYVTRVIEYEYDTRDRMTQDMTKWQLAPHQTLHAGPGKTMKSSIIVHNGELHGEIRDRSHKRKRTRPVSQEGQADEG